MQEIIITFNPVLILIAIVLTYMSVYSSLDLFTLLRTSNKSSLLLFTGGSLSLGFGIWAMNFIGMLSIDSVRAMSYNVAIIILSLLLAIIFTAIAFYFVINRPKSKVELLISSFFMMLAFLTSHIMCMYALNVAINYQPYVAVFANGMVFGAFFFTTWLLFYAKSIAYESHAWLKPVSALILTGAIAEGYIVLLKASSFYAPLQNTLAFGNHENMVMIVVVFIAILIISGLISSGTLISQRLLKSDINLKDIQYALNSSSIVAITDAKGIITYVNDKFVEISQYEEHELIGHNHSILNSGYHSKEFFQDLWRTIGNGQIWKGEVCNKAKDGSIYWVDTTIVPFLNSRGKPYQYVAIRTDISKRKQAEGQLKETLKEIKDIKFALDQSSIVAITDNHGIITKVNDKLCEISKYSREELIGQDHRILNSGHHSKEYFKNLWKTIGNGEVWKGEIQNKAKDGTLYWVDTTIVPFLNEYGKPYQYLAIRNDITERKKQEQVMRAQDKLATVGQLAAGVAHEIRNPLTSMKGYTEFLQLDEKSEERQEYLQIILEEIDRVNAIVEEFLLLANPHAVKLENKDIIPILKNVLTLTEFEARKRDVKFHFMTDHSSIWVNVDEDRIKQVFLNFIKNAIEAMPNGGDIFVKAVLEKGELSISIQDTGTGIPKEVLQRIGEPFFTTKKKGNGLGLMVSFKIIESHNGKVHVSSEENKGTIFNVVLPTQSA
ncbi:PAS domain S-box protein [Bacillus sp. HMF5848]|uniref:PAS domain S-box protein n=1 Tax=Bacillus sp. HMF5848 TaxID=2495421 RepID=UPI000F76C266|nr:PAS domain S-box protein [Bacillus sp. HMF5848]RSK27953.1 PAS domain S-box protein [Bacillus sp. HMF5848]